MAATLGMQEGLIVDQRITRKLQSLHAMHPCQAIPLFSLWGTLAERICSRKQRLRIAPCDPTFQATVWLSTASRISTKSKAQLQIESRGNP